MLFSDTHVFPAVGCELLRKSIVGDGHTVLSSWTLHFSRHNFMNPRGARCHNKGPESQVSLQPDPDWKTCIPIWPAEAEEVGRNQGWSLAVVLCVFDLICTDSLSTTQSDLVVMVLDIFSDSN